MVGESSVAKAIAGAPIVQAGVSQVTGALKNASFWLMGLGILHFLLRVSIFGNTNTTLPFFFSMCLFVLAGYALTIKLEKKKSAIMIPMFFFLLWYIVFKGNFDPRFLIYFLSIFFVLFVLPIIFTKGESAGPELLGFLPVVFFFLDIGLLPFLVEKLNWPITPLIENLVLFMPWWALFGLFTFPTEDGSSKTNFLITGVRILGIIYIVFLFIAPALPNVGYDKSALPGPQEFEAAQAKLRAQFPDKENPFISNMACLFTEFQDVAGCVSKRQEESEYKSTCENLKRKQSSDLVFDMDKCILDQKKKKEDPSLKVSGVVDNTIKIPTTAEIIVDQKLFPTEYSKDIPFSFDLKVKNPRKQEIAVEVYCNFTSKKEGESVKGEVKPSAKEIKFKEENFESSFLCIPDSAKAMDGTYTLFVEARFKGLKTTSRLQRAFIGQKTPEIKEKLRREEISKVIMVGESQAPADFARLNFDLGHALGDPIIEDKDYRNILLRSKIENIGPGRITKVESYKIDLEGFTPSLPTCLEGAITTVDSAARDIPLPSCVIDSYPTELKNPSDWVQKEFQGTITYDYVLTKDVSFLIKPQVAVN